MYLKRFKAAFRACYQGELQEMAWTEEQKIRYNATSREKYKRLKARGRCIRCGRKKAEPGRVKCRKCLEYNMMQKRRNALPAVEIERRLKNHLCYICAKPIDRHGGKICQSCWDRCSASGRKSARLKAEGQFMTAAELPKLE